MSRPVTVVVLAKYNDIFQHFRESVKTYEPDTPVILIRDGNGTLPADGWKVIQGPEKFSMAGNGNLGLKAVPKDHDILYCGDDIRFVQKDTISELQRLAYSNPAIGMLSPRLIGRGSTLLVSPTLLSSTVKDPVEPVPPIQFWFPCVYIKRELIDKIGFLDEEFNNFGSDDLDYVLRTKLAGYEVAVAAQVVVHHEAGPKGGPTTFEKNVGFEETQKQMNASFQKLGKKYDIDQYT